MKCLLASLIGVSILAEAFSLICYHCGGTAPSGPCNSINGTNNATVVCDDSASPANAVYGCRVYTVNYTTLNRVLEFKGCCLYEDCNENPCEVLGKGTVCSKMASCQADKCNRNYTTAIASPRPTLPPSSKACKLFFSHVLVTALAMLVQVVVLCLQI